MHRRRLIATTIGMSLGLATGTVLSRPVTVAAGEVDVRLWGVPQYKQRNGVSCGRTAAAMALANYGEISREDDMETSSMRKTFPDLIAINDAVAGSQTGLTEGFSRVTDGRVYGHYWSTDMNHWIEALWFNVATLQRPVICLIPKASNVDSPATIPHYVLVDGFTSAWGGTVSFSDPATGGRSTLTWDQFGAGWGKAEWFESTLIRPFQAVDVRRRGDNV